MGLDMRCLPEAKDRNHIFNRSRDKDNEGGDNGDVVKDEDEDEDGQDEVYNSVLFLSDEIDWRKDRNQIFNQRIRRKLTMKMLEDGQERNHHNHHRNHHHHQDL